ncbi:MAG: PKD domain-containing protein [Flavobacteriales bacterium]|nr:PKD domain-containing protein [Flavobacteriales bacterium]
MFKNWLLFTIIITCIVLRAYAWGPYKGIHTSYRSLGNDSIEVTIISFTDCFLQAIDSSGIGIWDELSIPQQVYWAYINNTSYVTMISEPCMVQGDYYDVCRKQVTYKGTIPLSAFENGDWMVTQSCCRYGVANIIEGISNEYLYLPLKIAQADIFSENNSPVFNSFPPAFCANEPLNYALDVQDPDGDSLSFSLCYAPSSWPYPWWPPGEPPEFSEIAWAEGYSYNYPIDSDPAFAIDPVTGQLSGTPLQAGSYAVSICIAEYRNGQLIEETRLDYNFDFYDCVFPEAQFSAPECAGLEITFENTSLNTSVFSWDFGVAGTENSSALQPQYTFPEPGFYDVQLIANPDSACTDTLIQTLSIDYLLDVAIESGESFCTDEAWEFPLSVGGFFGSNASFDWEFENGIPAQSVNTSPSVQWEEQGQFNITLFAFTDFCTDSAEISVMVQPYPSVEIVQPDTVCLGMEISFEAATQSAEDYSWNFGVEEAQDDVSSFAQPFYTYPASGEYLVVLQINNGTSCAIQDTVPVTVLDSEPITFSYSVVDPDSCQPNQSIELAWTGTGINYVVWNFGDGNNSNDQILSYQYLQEGNYEITLLAENTDCDYALSASFSVFVNEMSHAVSQPITFPNIITPDNNRMNEEFMPFQFDETLYQDKQDFMNAFNSFDLKVFNRWGSLVFRSSPTDPFWDGMVQEQLASAGAYFFTCAYQRLCTDMQTQIISGTVTVLSN